MDLTKFLNLILTEQLHFQRINSFKDIYEGYDQYFYNEVLARHFPDDSIRLKKLSEAIRFNTYVSCWHINEYESAAMWDLYANKSGSIAIETDVNTLKESFIKQPEQMLEFGEVVYLDYQEHKNTSKAQEIDEIFRCQFYKRKSFVHESEYRVILRPFNNENNKGVLYLVPIAINKKLEEIMDTPVSYRAKINIIKLIKKIYLSPDTPQWEQETIINLLKKLDLNIEVVKSNLYDLF